MNVFLDQVLESLNVGSLEMITKENMATMSNIALEYIENPQENLILPFSLACFTMLRNI